MAQAQPAQHSVHRKAASKTKQVTLKSVSSDLWLQIKIHAMRQGETVPEFMARAARETMKREATA